MILPAKASLPFSPQPKPRSGLYTVNWLARKASSAVTSAALPNFILTLALSGAARVYFWRR